MKILYIATAFARSEEDVITPWLTTTIKRLKDMGIEGEVLTSSYKGLKDQEIFGIRVHRFRYFFKRWEDLTHEENVPDRLRRSFRYKILLLFYIVFGLLRTYRLCRKERYSIIHCHWPLPHSLFGYLGKMASGAQLVSSFYSVELKLMEKNRLFLKPLVAWLIKKSDAVTAISHYTAANVKALCANKDISVIPFGSAVLGKEPSPPKEPPTKRKNILFVGRLVERKGVEYLIRAFNDVVKEIDALLIIIGDGSERTRLENLARELGVADWVKFTGYIPSQELKDYYENCDIFVLPAIVDKRGDTEGLGVVLLEAMSYKKPVIASRVGGIVDIVKDRETGILVSEKSPEELRDAILLLLKDDNLREAIAERGYKFVQREFSWERITNQLKDLYEDLLSPRNSLK